VTETVEIDENYPDHLRTNNRRLNRVSSGTYKEMEDAKDHDDDAESMMMESYPHQLARYDGFFPEKRQSVPVDHTHAIPMESTGSRTTPPSPSPAYASDEELNRVGSTVRRVQLQDPFQSVDSLDGESVVSLRKGNRGGE
jgi:hypothetical protein